LGLAEQAFDPGWVLASVSQQSVASATYPVGCEQALVKVDDLPNLSLSLSRYHVGIDDWHALFTQHPEQEVELQVQLPAPAHASPAPQVCALPHMKLLSQT